MKVYEVDAKSIHDIPVPIRVAIVKVMLGMLIDPELVTDALVADIIAEGLKTPPHKDVVTKKDMLDEINQIMAVVCKKHGIEWSEKNSREEFKKRALAMRVKNDKTLN